MTPQEEVFVRVEKFIQEQRIYGEETVYQSDRVIENAYDFIADLCRIVGYRDFKLDYPEDE